MSADVSNVISLSLRVQFPLNTSFGETNDHAAPVSVRVALNCSRTSWVCTPW